MTDETEKVGYDGKRVGWSMRSIVRKSLAFAAAALLLAGAVALSVVVFVFTLVGMIVVGAYFWWKTRDLRKHMRQHMHQASSEGDVIEGEVVGKVVRDLDQRDRIER